MKLYTIAFLAASTVASFGTVVIVTNGRGPTSTREITNPANALVAGFGAFGVLNEAGITGATTTFAGLNFTQFGAGAGAVTTSTSGQFSFTDNINMTPGGAGDPFNGKNIYLIAGFGGTSLATSTSLFIYKFADTYGLVDSATSITETLSSNAGTTLLGTEVGNPMTTASGRFAAATITSVPETSTALLGALGALGLLRRRR